MLNITNHQRNANQNHNEISTHTCKNDYHQEINKCWRGCGEKGTLTLGTLFVGMQTGATMVESSIKLYQKIKNGTAL